MLRWDRKEFNSTSFFLGDQAVHKQALKNIASMVRPGGILVIDHRNYDYILETGCAPPGKNIYYKVLPEISSWEEGSDGETHKVFLKNLQFPWLFDINSEREHGAVLFRDNIAYLNVLPCQNETTSSEKWKGNTSGGFASAFQDRIVP